jgi:hypothetical protein
MLGVAAKLEPRRMAEPHSAWPRRCCSSDFC